jgi:hypothetical protein
MDKFDWKSILRSDSVLRVSNYPEDILQLAGDIRIMPDVNARAIDNIIQEIEREDDPFELIRGLIAVDLPQHGMGTLLKLSSARSKPLAELAKTELIIRGHLN